MPALNRRWSRWWAQSTRTSQATAACRVENTFPCVYPTDRNLAHHHLWDFKCFTFMILVYSKNAGKSIDNILMMVDLGHA